MMLATSVVAIGAVAAVRPWLHTHNANGPVTGWIDSLAHDGEAIPQFGRVRVIGWAGARDANASIADVRIELDRRPIARTTTGDPRPDVAEALHRADYESSGWHSEFPIGSVSPGTHVLTALACSTAGSCARLQGEIRFEVAANAPAVGAIDSISTSDGSRTVPQSGWVTVEGWAADPDGTRPPSEIDILVDDVAAARAVLRPLAPQKAADIRIPHSIRWRSRFNVGGTSAGTHRLSAEAVDDVGGRAKLGSDLTLIVSPNRSAPRGGVDAAFDALTMAPDHVTQYGILQVDGWASDAEQGSPVSRVVVNVDGSPRIEASTDFESDHAPDASRSGWHAWLDVGPMQIGPHEISVTAYDSAGKPAPLGSRVVTVTEGASLSSRLAAALRRRGAPVQTQGAPAGDYIWTDPQAPPVAERTFRGHFRIDDVPSRVSLIAFGPDLIDVAVNGDLVASAVKPPEDLAPGQLVVREVSRSLHAGDNVIAILTRGGDRLAAGLFTTPYNGEPSALAVTGPAWRARPGRVKGWQSAVLDDRGWAQAHRIGGLDSTPGAREHNADARLYPWPRYAGISREISAKESHAILVRDVRPESTRFENLRALVGDANEPFRAVQDAPSTNRNPPSVVLDFGRVLSGRLKFVSGTDSPVTLRVQLGESVEEALRGPYLGNLAVDVAPRGIAFGPKSSFRYAWVALPTLQKPVELKAILAQELGRPVDLRGSFESSDRMLNDIWMAGAYTVSLAMQESFWDAPKRDRRPFAGDLHVAARTARAAFGETRLTLQTLLELADEAMRTSTDINTIPGYNAFWILSLSDLCMETDDDRALQTASAGTRYVVERMLQWLDADAMFANQPRRWLFVDWSPPLDGDSSESRTGTQLEYCYALLQSVPTLQVQGAAQLAARAAAVGRQCVAAAKARLLDSDTRTFGKTWQTNAFAVFSGLFGAPIDSAIRDRVLGRPPHAPVSPYYLYYGLEAFARLHEYARALELIRERWGAMLERGATTFWEVYDPSWPTVDFHRALRVNASGYFVSLAHAWSTGPTAWLTEQVLGIRPGEAGWKHATIEPVLADLQWARGVRPTPFGSIKVDYRRRPNLTATIELPPAVTATLYLPSAGGSLVTWIDGRAEPSEGADDRRVRIELRGGGVHRIELKP
jgi:alpha-L-rhamnosidase